MNYYAVERSTALTHHGILGQKWGIRRFQDKSGRLTSAGKNRYKTDNSRSDDPTDTRGIKNRSTKIATERENLAKAFRALNGNASKEDETIGVKLLDRISKEGGDPNAASGLATGTKGFQAALSKYYEANNEYESTRYNRNNNFSYDVRRKNKERLDAAIDRVSTEMLKGIGYEDDSTSREYMNAIWNYGRNSK